MIIAGLDLGQMRIGVAISDTLLKTTQPITTIARRSLAQDLAALERELKPRGVEKIIVGLPLNMDGSEGAPARRMRGFAARLHDTLRIPVELCDERLTTFEARERLRGLPLARSRRRAATDALAAMLVLETWLATRPDLNA